MWLENFSGLDKVEELRRVIQDRFYTPPQQQRLSFGGQLLEDGRTLGDYHIKAPANIRLTLVPTKGRLGKFAARLAKARQASRKRTVKDVQVINVD